MHHSSAGHMHQAQQVSGHTCMSPARPSQPRQAHASRAQPVTTAVREHGVQAARPSPQAHGRQPHQHTSKATRSGADLRKGNHTGAGWTTSMAKGNRPPDRAHTATPKDAKGRDPCMQAIFGANSIQQLYDMYQTRYSLREYRLMQGGAPMEHAGQTAAETRFSMGVPHQSALLVRLPKLLDPQTEGMGWAAREQITMSAAERQQQLWQAHRLAEGIILFLIRRLPKLTYRTLVNCLWAVAKLDYEPDVQHMPAAARTRAVQQNGTDSRSSSNGQDEHVTKAAMALMLTEVAEEAASKGRLQTANLLELSNLAYALARLPTMGLLTVSQQAPQGGKAAARGGGEGEEELLSQQLSRWWSDLLSAAKATKGMPQASEQELVMFGWAMARSEEAAPDMEFLVAFFMRLEQLLPSMRQHSLSISMWAAATLAASLTQQQLDQEVQLPAAAAAAASGLDAANTRVGPRAKRRQVTTTRQALDSLMNQLIHVLVEKQLQGGWRVWHSQHVANIVWALATFKPHAWRSPGTESVGGAAALDQYGVQLAEWADAHFVANHARYQQEEMAMLSWSVARLGGRCSRSLLTLLTQSLEDSSAHQNTRNLLCFATAATCTGAGNMAGSDRGIVTTLRSAPSKSRYGGRVDYAAPASIDMTLLTAEEGDGPRCQDDTAYALGRAVFLRLRASALRQPQHGAEKHRRGVFKAFEICGIIVMAARLGAATAAEVEEMSDYVVSRCTADAPMNRATEEGEFDPYMFTIAEQVVVLAACGYVGARAKPLCEVLAPVFKAAAWETATVAEKQLAAVASQQQQGMSDSDKQQLMVVIANAQSTSPRRIGFKDLADATWGFAKAGWQDMLLYHAIARASQQLLLLQHSLVTSSEVLDKDATAGHVAPSRAAGSLSTSYQLATSIAGTHITPDSMLALARGLSAVNYYNEALYDAMVLACRSMVGFCSAAQLVSIACAMAHAQHYSLPLFNQLATAALGCMDQFNDSQVGHMAWAFANMHVYHPGLFKALVAHAVLLLESGQLSVRGAGMLLWSCAVLQHHEPAALTRIYKLVWDTAHPNNLMHETCNQVYFGYIMTVLSRSQDPSNALTELLSLDTLPHLSNTADADELHVLWPPDTTATAPVKTEPQVASPTGRRQRPRRGEGLSYPPPIPWEQREVLASIFLGMKRTMLVTSDMQAEVFKVLQDMGTQPRLEVSIMSGLWHLDVVVQWQGQAVAVEVDGPHHFARNVTTHALGHTVARNRCLKALGVRLACLHWQEWKAACKAHAASIQEAAAAGSSSAAADAAEQAPAADGNTFKVQHAVRRTHRWREHGKQSRNRQESGQEEAGVEIQGEEEGSDAEGALPASVPIMPGASRSSSGRTSGRHAAVVDARVALLKRLLNAAANSRNSTSHRQEVKQKGAAKEAKKGGVQQRHIENAGQRHDSYEGDSAGGLLPDVPLQVRYSVYKTPRRPQAVKLDSS